MAALIIFCIFISATFGAFFGFLGSRSGEDVLNAISGGRFASIFSQNSEPEVVKQKIIQEDSAVIDVVKKASPAVVSIVISKDVPKIQSRRGIPDFFGSPFEFYFGQGEDQESGSEKLQIGGGTGFLITEDGMIVTNRHVVEDSNATYTVVTNDNQSHDAKIMAVDPVNDIAIIKIEGEKYPTLSLGNSDNIQIGQTVIAIGNSLGEFSNTVSRGIISGLRRNVTAGNGLGTEERLNNIIQTDAAINPGNSGGPLLDIDGRVIGINVAIAQGAQNIGFAIPASQVERVVTQVKTTGKISTPFIGLRYISVDSTLQKANNLPYEYGVLIVRGDRITDFAVIPGSPADKAGIVENDIILEIDGKKLDRKENTLAQIVASHNVGDEITLKVWHRGEIKDVQVTLEERK